MVAAKLVGTELAASVVMVWKRALIIGASSGIGEALAKHLAANGCRVSLVARREDRLRVLADSLNAPTVQNAAYYVHDVRNAGEVPELFTRIVEEMGGLDVVFYVAGVMKPISRTEYDFQKDKEMIDTNFTGAVAWLNQAAKRFERLSGGTIVGIGSPSGDRGRRGNPVYGASKAALECYLESLRNRLSQHGVSVVTAKLGPVSTDMTAALGKLPGMIDVEEAVRGILRGAQRFGKTFYVPWKFRVVMWIVERIPSPLFRRMKF